MASLTDSGQRVVTNSTEDQISDFDGSFDEIWQIPQVVHFITSNAFTRIALQFPESLLSHASLITRSLIRQLEGHDLMIVSEGGVGEGVCCVDHVTSSHCSPHAIVHYGPACLSRTRQTVPTMHVFLRRALEISNLVGALSGSFEFLQCLESGNSRLVVVFDLAFSHLAKQIEEAIQSVIGNKKVVMRCVVHTVLPENKNSKEVEVCSLPCGAVVEENDVILWIGEECAELSNILICYNSHKIWKFDSSNHQLELQGSGTNRQLMKRYNLIQRTIDASVIGILVATLSVDGYNDVVRTLRENIHKSGRKSYTIVVGRLNEPKLANFSEIEIFVIVGCRLHSLVDSKMFFQPIITPFELNIALAEGKTWTGAYSTDFSTFLNQSKFEKSDFNAHNDDSIDGDSEVRTSLVKNQVVRRPQIQYEQTDTSSSTSLIQRNTQQAVIISPAAEALSKRTFIGIDARLGQDHVMPIVEGRKGIASHFEGEPE